MDAVARDPDALARCLAMIRTTDWNAALVELLEARDDQALDAVRVLAEAVGVGRAGPEILRAVAAGHLTSLERETSLHTLRGNRRTVAMQATIIPGHEESLSRILLAVVDITARKQAEDALRASAENFQFLAVHDSLTGLYNTRYLYEALERLVEEAQRVGGRFSVVFMDLDRFKRVVDELRPPERQPRHPGGGVDDPRRAAGGGVRGGVRRRRVRGRAARLRQGRRRRDGGDHPHARRAHHLPRRRRADVSLTMSLGVATFPEDADGVQRLLASADRALFAIKGAGRNAVGRAAAG